jgi:hypothetical protein
VPAPQAEPRRRAVIAVSAVSAAAIPLAAGLAACTSRSRAHRFFTAHQAAVVQDATARIAPGPQDDPLEKGHPGAREANVTGYIDTMLGALDNDRTPSIFARGPWSNRHTSGPDLMTRFVSLTPVAEIAWRRRLTTWQDQYRQGIKSLDKLAGGDFTEASHQQQDKILATRSVAQFTALLFEHTIEGLYASPEYGGNRNLAGWQEIGFPGDVQPRGYTADEVERSDGHDPIDNTGIVADVLKILDAL